VICKVPNWFHFQLSFEFKKKYYQKDFKIFLRMVLMSKN